MRETCYHKNRMKYQGRFPLTVLEYLLVYSILTHIVSLSRALCIKENVYYKLKETVICDTSQSKMDHFHNTPLLRTPNDGFEGVRYNEN